MAGNGWALSLVLLLVIFSLTFVVFGQDQETDTPPEADTPVEDEDEEEIEVDIDSTTKYVRIGGVWYVEKNGIRSLVPNSDLTIVKIGESSDGTSVYNMPTAVVTAPKPPSGDGILTSIRPPSSSDLPWRVVWVPELVTEPPVVSVPVGTAWRDTTELTISVDASPALKSGDFITDDVNHYMTATTEAEEVTWKATPRNGAGALSFSPSNGKTPKIAFSPVDDTTGHPPLSYVVTGRTEFAADSDSFKQNNLSRLRQEYVNMGKLKIPAASAFDTEDAAYPNVDRWGLLNDNDVHDYHDYHILSFINQKARLLKQKYTGDFIFTAGYACPVESGHGLESQHIYGKALDYDAGADSEATSIRNLAIYWVGRDSLDATWYALYDRNGKFYRNVDRDHSKKPENFAGEYYGFGHMDWRARAQP